MNQSTKGLVLVTGGSRGIGAETAMLAAARGYTVCVNFHSNSRAAEKVVWRIEESGGSATSFKADISIEADVLRLFEYTDSLPESLVGLVNNAGILETQMPLVEMTAARIERIFSINVTGCFLCAREAIKRMSVKSGGNGGSIVNISSVASRTGSPHEYIDYAASKGAIDTMTIGLAKEVAAEDIRVNCVRPGLTHTEIHASGGEANRIERLKGRIPLQRGGLPEEVAAAVVWLLSEEASYTTGALLDVAGGL
ncbi:MAG: SDR family oxidoreductase [Calditrichia bacterium]